MTGVDRKTIRRYGQEMCTGSHLGVSQVQVVFDYQDVHGEIMAKSTLRFP